MPVRSSDKDGAAAAPAIAPLRISKRQLTEALRATSGKVASDAAARDWFQAVAAQLRERILASWTERAADRPQREANYLSIEYLPGRLLLDLLNNLGLLENFRSELDALGIRIEDLAGIEPEPGLGNGGLGRLASCLLDSFATLGLPVWGYGIRYEHGLFLQRFSEGRQVELPDRWLSLGYPWEFQRPDRTHSVPFHGRMEGSVGADGRVATRWVENEPAVAMAYDLPVIGYRSGRVNRLRLWSVVPAGGMPHIDGGDKAVRELEWDEDIAAALYPNDKTEEGRKLRLRQEFFLASASVQDILARHRARGRPLDALAAHVAIHINDTHPTIVIAELMRLLVDVHGMSWKRAWEITRNVCSYTNHTLMPEALETWPVRMFEELLPRHLEIVYEINEWLLAAADAKRPNDVALLRRLSIIDEERGRRVRMANLCFAGSHRVNGVSKMHAELMKKSVFADFDHTFPGRILGITNGVTPRRWLCIANPGLSALVGAVIGEGWQTDLGRLRALDELAGESAFGLRFRAVKQKNKQRLAALVRQRTGVEIDPDAMLDVHIKRIHEYKRQLLKLLHCVVLYRRILDGAEPLPRVVLFGGKAAPGYERAKLIIRLINDVAAAVNADPHLHGRLKIAFLPNYGVSDAEHIVAAADLSEQISTAGMEASGTGNMKLGLNGALTVGTLDGANVEILEAVGPANIFIFGHKVEELAALQARGYDPNAYRDRCAELDGALRLIETGHFSPGEPARYRPLLEDLVAGGDRYFLLADFEDYLACQDRIEPAYRSTRDWTQCSIRNVARLGDMSSDRAARQYAEEIWKLEPDAVAMRVAKVR